MHYSFGTEEKSLGLKGSEGSSQVINATKFCLTWRKSFEFLLDTCERLLLIKKSQTGNIFGTIMAFVRRCKSFMEICQSNAQLYRWVHSCQRGSNIRTYISAEHCCICTIFVFVQFVQRQGGGSDGEGASNRSDLL